jgi:mono/diheme cytochrome c family protein
MDADAGAAADSAIAATTATSLTPEAYFLPMDDARRPAYLLRMRGRAVLPAILFGVLGMVVAGVAVGFAVGHYSLRVTTVTIAAAPAAGGTPSSATASVDPAIAAGAHTFVQFACVQCHGFRGRGGISPDVPALTTVGKALTVAQLSHIIDHGLGESKNPTKPYMPVWGEVISKTQVGDLVAYIRAGLPAVPDTQPVAIPQGQGAAVAGAALYVRYGCINCHGPNGLGGVSNPLSPDKSIPPLSGGGFRHDFPTDKAIADIIRSGSVIGRAPIVSMPHWGGIIPATDVQSLIAYLKTLK